MRDISRPAFVPQDKHDHAAIEVLDSLSFEEVEPHLDALIEWLGDINWPVARPLARRLIGFGARVEPALLRALHGDDEVLKYWLIEVVCEPRAAGLGSPLLAAIERIAASPTAAEHAEEVDRAAEELLRHRAASVPEPSSRPV